MYRPFQFNKRSQFFIRTNDEKIVRPSESKADTQPQLHPALLRLSAMIAQCFHIAPGNAGMLVLRVLQFLYFVPDPVFFVLNVV